MFFCNDTPARAGNTMTLYRQVAVWKRVSESEATRYHLIEDLSERKFSVQSKDFFYPSTPYDTLLYLEKLFPDLLMAGVSERTWFDNIEEAVEDFDAGFLSDLRQVANDPEREE
jgi:hypothetical protein